MHVAKIVTQLLSNVIHKTRVKSLIPVITALITSKQLKLTQLGSTRFGFSMNENVTIKAERYTVWLLIAALASLIAWIIGYAAEQQNLHYEFQANTYRHRRVLSFFYLGCQIVKKQIDVSIDLDHIRLSAWDAVAWDTLC